MPEPIVFDGFTKSYRRSPVVENLSFTVRAESVMGLLGPNGAGKSTAMRGLVGLLHATRGRALAFGAPFHALANPARRIGVQMDGLGYESGISVRRHLEIYRRAAGMGRGRVDEVLHEVELAEHARKRVKKLSTGLRQRLGLATALLGRPEVLILDEPANGLDPAGVRWLRRFIRAFAGSGGTVLISSHQLAELEQTVDDVVVMSGRPLYIGPLTELTQGGGMSLEGSYFELIDATRGAN